MAFVVVQPAPKAAGGAPAGFRVVDRPGHDSTPMDMLKSFGSNALESAAALGQQIKAGMEDFGMAAGQNEREANQYVAGVASGGKVQPSNQGPVNVRNDLQAAGLHHDPQTRAGRYAGAVGAMLPNALAGPAGAGKSLAANVLARGAQVVVPGMMSEGARETASALGAGPRGQAVASVVGGVLGGVASTVRVNPAAAATADPAINALASRGRLDPVQMRAKAAEMRAAGVDPTLTDVSGEAGRRVIRAVGVKTPEAGETLQAAAKSVSATTKPAVMARTRSLTGDPRTATQFADDLTAARDAAAQSNYKGPYSQAVQVPESVRDMLRDSSGRSIVARARADAIENQDWGGQAELDKLLKVGDGPLPQVSAATVDRLTIAARERGAAFAASGRNYRARGAFERRNQLDATLNDVKELQPARADYRAKSQGIDIINKPGVRKDVFSTNPTDYKAWIEALPPEARQANAVAVRQEIMDTLGGQRASTLGSIDELASSQYAKANLTHALGDEAAPYLANLNARLEQTRNAGFVAPNGGSRTEVLRQDIPGAERALEMAQTGAQALRGDWVPVAVKALRAMGINDTQAARIATLASDPKHVDDVIGYLERTKGPKAARSFKALIPATSGVIAATRAERAPSAAQ